MMLSELIAQFKKTESAENIVPLVESEELRNGVVAWKSVVVRFEEESEELRDGASSAEQWEWMWSHVSFDMPAFSVVAGVQQQHASRLFGRLKGLRLIYPDGEINTFAAKYLQAIIMAKLPKPPKAKPPTP